MTTEDCQRPPQGGLFQGELGDSVKKISRLVRAAVVGALALGGVVAGTSNVSAATSNWGCRSERTGSFADAGHGIHLDSCIEDQWGNNGSGFYARIAVTLDPGSGSAHPAVFPCAQLWKSDGFGGWSYVHDYGCMGTWYGPGTNDAIWISDGGQNYNPGSGAYVVRVGFWATINGHYGYYGDVESPVASVW
ncbi:hypothetical protein [Streptomyces barringtoniae]|uniref:hypothetical protein n=1 Tax=Streptomyces barringtoniae TaxID=2892029 RepID=UPI001E31563A|nr:hypothetical protein [Streptomyces barringtoniae]MCC5474580.1 hypothetical protein [Streptomyces barringtoniae]